MGYKQGWEDAERGGLSKTYHEDGGYEYEPDVKAFRSGYSQGWEPYMRRLTGKDSRSGGD